ncbi:hypothetical protein RDWZM_010171, partial [Blomia tropicalis]
MNENRADHHHTHRDYYHLHSIKTELESESLSPTSTSSAVNRRSDAAKSATPSNSSSINCSSPTITSSAINRLSPQQSTLLDQLFHSFPLQPNESPNVEDIK